MTDEGCSQLIKLKMISHCSCYGKLSSYLMIHTQYILHFCIKEFDFRNNFKSWTPAEDKIAFHWKRCLYIKGLVVNQNGNPRAWAGEYELISQANDKELIVPLFQDIVISDGLQNIVKKNKQMFKMTFCLLRWLFGRTRKVLITKQWFHNC